MTDVTVTAHALARFAQRIGRVAWRRAERMIRAGVAAPVAWRAITWDGRAATDYGVVVHDPRTGGTWRFVATVTNEAPRRVVTIKPATRGSSGAGRPRTRGAQLTWTRSTWTQAAGA